MRHLVKSNFEPLFKNLFDIDGSVFNTNESLPAVNIAENENEYHLEFALAGYKKEDLKINLEQDTLTVSAKVENEKNEESEDKKYTRREYSSKSFSRSFYLPKQVSEKDINAEFENGVLKLVVPKISESNVKEISIK